MRHVKSQLAAYVEGFLTAKQAKRVQAHIAICTDCRDELVRHEQVARDVRLTLAVSPRQVQITQWWEAIQSARITVPTAVQQPNWSAAAMLPTLIAVCVIVLPLIVGLSGQFNGTAFAAGTYSAPAAVVTNQPPTGQSLQTQEPSEAKTASLLEVTSASLRTADSQSTEVPFMVIPAPLAP